MRVDEEEKIDDQYVGEVQNVKGAGWNLKIYINAFGVNLFIFAIMFKYFDFFLFMAILQVNIAK